MTAATWRCHACDTFNEHSRKRCQVCEEPRRAEAPAASAPGPTWRCHACDTFNRDAASSCELCDTARDATVNLPRPAPEGPEPRSSPRRSPPRTARSTRGSAPSHPAPAGRRPGPEPAPPADPPEEIFFPEFSAPPTVTMPPAPPPPPPLAPPGGWSSPGYAAPTSGGGAQGCGWAAAVAVILVALLFIAAGCVSLLSSLDGYGDGTREDSAPREEGCPARVADRLPDAGPATLVEAFETERHRIILCADADGQLYYHGEIPDAAEEPLLIPAERTADGYLARNGAYTYEITGDTVVVSNGGGEIARYTLRPWEDPA
ncbi:MULTISPECIES: hypothetical protein [unclassified Nocardiopsis]|uniref:hypothetical protein n=1 Tax=unclassified Nocardiopsis TaxID=2649073 RepID=UPI00135A6A02|nr:MULTISPECIES: hypothetical protein [unclassified Nocardiopsis]